MQQLSCVFKDDFDMNTRAIVFVEYRQESDARTRPVTESLMCTRVVESASNNDMAVLSYDDSKSFLANMSYAALIRVFVLLTCWRAYQSFH